MKLLNLKTLIFSLLSFVVLIAAAQRNETQYADYVIKLNGDSVRCTISTPLFGFMKYKSASMNKPQKVTTDSIKEYSIAVDHKIYRRVFRDGLKKPEFMNVIENGTICIYEVLQNTTYSGPGLTLGAGATVRDWYVGKNSDKVTALKSSSMFIADSRKARKDLFKDMLEDKPDIYNKYVADKKFTFKQIRSLIHLYNTGEELKEK
jgi:hypothetical protein